MFKCDKCNKTTQSRESCNKVVVKTRYKVYYYLKTQERQLRSETKIFNTQQERFNYRTKLMGKKNYKEWETKGSEIVKEQKLCGSCYE